MNHFRISAIFISLALFIPITIHADTITTVSVTNACTVTDTENNPHVYSGQFLGICALEAAKNQGAVSAYTLQNFSFGLFLQSLGGITPGATQFWSISQNGAEALVGLGDMTITSGDILSFQLTDWTDNSTVGPPVQFKIGALTSAATNETNSANAVSSQSGGGEYLKGRKFDVYSALDFLSKRQNSDGSFASALLTDWAAIAFGATDTATCNDSCKTASQKLRLYLFDAKLELSSVTDYERHAMALMALGINPYSETKIDYITPIVSAFDGVQVGDASLVNDDIFAIFPLIHAGYTKDDNIVKTIVSFILFKQKPNGSWEGSTDLTAAAIQALQLFPSHAGAPEAVEKAKEFLHRNQNDSGIFGSNSFSLSWVLQAIASLKETPADWKKSGLTPLEYLGVLQQEDGGVEPMSVSVDTRVWATAYAIPGVLAKPWNDILGRFARPAPIAFTATPTDRTATATPPTQPAPEVFASANSSVTTPGKPISAPDSIPTTTNAGQLATVYKSGSNYGTDSIWTWFSGLILILGGTFYFLTRLPAPHAQAGV